MHQHQRFPDSFALEFCFNPTRPQKTPTARGFVEDKRSGNNHAGANPAAFGGDEEADDDQGQANDAAEDPSGPANV